MTFLFINGLTDSFFFFFLSSTCWKMCFLFFFHYIRKSVTVCVWTVWIHSLVGAKSPPQQNPPTSTSTGRFAYNLFKI